MDSQGRLFVGDRTNNRVQVFDQSGKLLASWKQFGRPSGIFIDRNDRIYVTDSESREDNKPEDYGYNPGVRRGDGGKRYWRPQERAMVERARQLMARFDMSAKEDEYAGNLSGGQKRLLELMRGLMANPTLLLLDEPMAGVNPSLARRIEQHLADLVGEGLTMLMIEHELAVVERLCDSIVVMAQGRVISEGTMADIRSDQEVLDAYLIG